MVKKLLIGGVIGGILYYMYHNVNNFSNSLKFKFLNVGFDSSKTAQYYFTKIALNLNLELGNSSNLSLNINRFDVTADVNGLSVATATKTEKIFIAGQGKTNVSIPIMIDTFALFPTVADFLDAIKTKKSITAEIKGTAMTNVGNVDFKQTVKIL